MARGRALTQLRLTKAFVSGMPGWVQAFWTRADGSDGTVFVGCRRESADRWYISDLWVPLPTAALLRDVPLARIQQAVNADATIREWIEQHRPAPVKTPRGRTPERQKLERPSHRALSEDFYRDVAAAYRSALAHGLHPAKTLAEDSDTPPGTVNRWIAEARGRGFLPKTTSGKARA